MAVRLPKSVYVHLMKTGGWSVRVVLSNMNLNTGEIGRHHDPACVLKFNSEPRPFTFVFVRHPLTWYRSYWAYRMQHKWTVYSNLPITGWQTFGSILDHECRADDFEKWMRKVLDYVPEGFLSRIYRIYTDGVDFIGRVESLREDFSRALTLAGEDFSPELIQSLPKQNATVQKFLAVATLPKELAEKVMEAESYVTERWGYDSIPSSMIKVAGRPAHNEAAIEKHQKLLDQAVAQNYLAPKELNGRGIVICGGGTKYFPCAWVCINMLRRLGCRLPIRLWHLGKEEMSDQMRDLVVPLNVETVDGRKIRETNPARILNGWELKPYAIIHSPFREVLFLDSDNVPVVNPEFLFDTHQYKETGATLWPDYSRLAPERTIWKICRVPYSDEPEVESGQIVIDKERCWKALQITMHMNEYSDFYYKHIFGDKETFHMAFRRIGQEYSMPAKGIHSLDSTMCQHDFDGRIIFQHRNMAKWNINSANKKIAGFKFEAECLKYLEDLKMVWSERFREANPHSNQKEIELVPATSAE